MTTTTMKMTMAKTPPQAKQQQ